MTGPQDQGQQHDRAGETLPKSLTDRGVQSSTSAGDEVTRYAKESLRSGEYRVIGPQVIFILLLILSFLGWLIFQLWRLLSHLPHLPSGPLA